MQIKEVQIDNNVTITVSGRIDIETSQILEASIEKWLPSPAINKIILNLSAVEYIYQVQEFAFFFQLKNNYLIITNLLLKLQVWFANRYLASLEQIYS